MIRKLCLALGMVAAMAVAPRAQAATPNRLVEEGRLADASGNPLSGSVSLTFSLYVDATTATPLWTESQTVTVNQGYFSAELGASVPFPAGTFDGSVRYLGIAVDTDAEMQPRQIIDSVPYALVANDVVGDAHPTSLTVNGTLLIDSNGNWVGPTTGLQGPAGAQGPVGPVGPQGVTGPAGATGAAGAQGPQGATGPAGAQGPQGVTGATGAPGSQGATGPAGAQGPSGSVCAQGPQGATGAAGAQGPQGATGPTGAQGPQGPAGATGPTGAQGPQGATGASPTINQNVFTVFGTSSATTNTSTFVIVPGLTQTVTVPANSKVLISTYGGVLSNATTASGFSITDVSLVIDGASAATGAYQRITLGNTAGVTSNMIGNWSFTTSQTLTAGSHTFAIEAIGISGSTATVGAGTNSVLQGELTITIVNL